MALLQDLLDFCREVNLVKTEENIERRFKHITTTMLFKSDTFTADRVLLRLYFHSLINFNPLVLSGITTISLNFKSDSISRSLVTVELFKV